MPPAAGVPLEGVLCFVSASSDYRAVESAESAARPGSQLWCALKPQQRWCALKPQQLRPITQSSHQINLPPGRAARHALALAGLRPPPATSPTRSDATGRACSSLLYALQLQQPLRKILYGQSSTDNPLRTILYGRPYNRAVAGRRCRSNQAKKAGSRYLSMCMSMCMRGRAIVKAGQYMKA